VYNFSVKDADTPQNTASVSYNLTDPVPLSATFNVTPNSSWPMVNGEIDATVVGGTGKTTYLWIDSVDNQEYTTEDLLSVPPSTYYYKVQDINKCLYFDTVTVPDNSKLDVDMTIVPAACFRSTVAVTVAPQITNVDTPTVITTSHNDTVIIVGRLAPPDDWYIILNNNNERDTVTGFSYTFSPGENWVKVVANGTHRGFRHYWVTDSTDTPIEISFVHSDIECFVPTSGYISFVAQGSYGGFLYGISGPDNFISNSNVVSGLKAGTYLLTATDVQGCTKSQTVEIIKPDNCTPFYEFISPGSDGYNDTWEIRTEFMTPGIVVEIRDKYNHLVFYSEGYQTQWDGTKDGEKLPDGVYRYYVHYTDRDDTFMGEVLLINEK
jgi:gliding motility-associated-like protein